LSATVAAGVGCPSDVDELGKHPDEISGTCARHDCRGEHQFGVTAASYRGSTMALQTWFKDAHRDAVARDMNVQCDNHGFTLSLLHLSPNYAAWPPRPAQE